MLNYKNSIIYKIVCKNPEITEIYVGSTTNFTKRKYNHKTLCNNINDKSYNLNVYKYIRENGGWDNFNMIMIERYEAIDKLDLHKRERYFLEQLGATLNKVIPHRSIEEYYEYTKKYYENNKEHIKKYREDNKDKKKEYNKVYEKEKVKCNVCSKILSRGSLYLHNKKFHK